MSGFSFSLKANKVSKDKKGRPTNLLSKRTLPKKNALFNDEDIPTDTKTSIDAFDSAQGAMSGSTAVSKAPELIIKPLIQTHTLRKPNVNPQAASPADNVIAQGTQILSAEEKARKSLLSGESFDETNHKVIAGNVEDADAETETAQEDYDAVPVDQFGAALLRGMGWSGEPDKKSAANKEVSHRKQGAVLGIGAKSIEKDLEAELLSKKNLSVPIIRRESSFDM
ncbi:hypothetical protein JCM33374_g1168 [Metschnikowia sp. JCM 33374]|nr:hypothetical protein JCM33374_g1168 [Metschnikowia sp. JCM 33374]